MGYWAGICEMGPDGVANESRPIFRSFKLTMVGHSLGGGLADAAAIVTNRPAVTFNAAGLSGSTRNGYGSFIAGADNYYVQGELLAGIVNNIPIAPTAFGHQHALARPSGYEISNPLSLHLMTAVLKALDM